MLLVRNKEKKGTYFGPFLQKQTARTVYNFLKKTFHLGLCSKKLEHGCLEYHLGICAGTCKPDFSIDEYCFNLELAQHVLRKDREQFLALLRSKIKKYSALYMFEKAQKLTELLHDFEHIFQVIENHYSETRYENDIFYVSHKRPYAAPVSRDVGEELATLVGYEGPIITIDCFDISHFQSKNMVGSCVRFKHGMPEKNKFRRFLIKTITEQNDYAALQEVVQRRYKDGEDIPDLILIDGGKGQLSAVQAVLPEAPLASLAKREETVYTPRNGNGIKLDLQSEAGRLLIAIRDYAHHFALTYHRLRRRKKE
jgi:excinuclease ABC subunit C